MPAKRLSDIYRTAFVTGASGGLGHAFVCMLLDEGLSVWGTARDTKRLDRLSARRGFTPVGMDLSEGAGSVAAFERASAATSGGVYDLVIQNAGYGVFGEFAGSDWRPWAEQLETMLVNTARISHAAMASWQGRGDSCLVHVTSLAVEFPIPFQSGYNAAKAGLAALSESLDLETRGTAVRVIDFRPGDYRTDFNRAQISAKCASAPGLVAAPVSGSGTASASITDRVWCRIEANLEAAPAPQRAASDLRRALLQRRRGRVRSGGFFQARIAPLLARFDPSDWRLRLIARYFDLHR